jgi:hypothetical protein
MKTEDFDEAIRKKLESVNQTYTESEIDKVYRHVAGKRRFPWKGSNTSWLLYSVAAAAITVLTFLAVSRFGNEKKENLRNDSISQSLKDSDSIQRLIIEPASDSAKATGDTIVSVQSLKIRPQALNDKQSIPLVPAVSVPADKIRVPEQKAVLPQPKNIQPVNTTKTDSKPISEPDAVAAPENIAQAVSKPEPVEKRIAPVDTLTMSNPVKPVAVLPVSIPVTVSPIAEAKQKSDDIRTEITKDVSENKQDTLVREKSRKAKPPTDNTGTTSTKPEITETPGAKPGNMFKNAEVRTGADFKLSNHLYGMGVTGELLLKNHLSFETGLNYSVLQTEHYTDTADVFQHKHHDFNHRIEDHLHDKDQLSEIAIDNRLLQVPISFNYFVPLKRNFSLSFSLGTDLDIYLNQKISYSHEGDSGRMDKSSFSTKGDVATLNNLVISARLEKRWKSLVFQIQPFISPQLKQVFYKPEEMEFGAGIGIRYSFGKQ